MVREQVLLVIRCDWNMVLARSEGAGDLSMTCQSPHCQASSDCSSCQALPTRMCVPRGRGFVYCCSPGIQPGTWYVSNKYSVRKINRLPLV